MRIKSIYLVVFLLTSLIFTTLSANPPKQIPKAKARVVLVRTTRAINQARVALKKEQNFSGHFKKAVLHQRLAKKLYTQGKYRKAIFHSRYARRMAFVVISENKGTKPQDLEETSEEKGYGEASDAELEKEVKASEKENATEEELLKQADLGISID